MSSVQESEQAAVPAVKQEEAAAPDSAAPAVPNPNPIDEDDRKLFVGGLPQDCTQEEIKEFFSGYGEVQGVNLKTDMATGRSRGFAFVLFTTVDPVLKVIAEETHTIKNKKVAIKRAQAKQGKVYVGKIKPDITEEDLRTFFGTYGNVMAVEQPYDKVKGEKKNFCFISFDRETPAKQLLKEGVVTVKGYELEVKKVTPKPEGMMMGGGGGRGGGAMGGFGRGGGQAWGGGYGGQWGMGGGGAQGYGDYWGAYGGGFDPYYGGGGWGAGYGGGAAAGFGGNGGGYGSSPGGGKAPRGRGGVGGGARGRGGAGRGQRQQPY